MSTNIYHFGKVLYYRLNFFPNVIKIKYISIDLARIKKHPTIPVLSTTF